MKLPPLLRPQPGAGTLKEVPWGGTRLAERRGGDAHRGRTIGESWEFSTLPGRVSRANDHPLDHLLGGPLPFLAKLLDTARALSVQLHPGDDPDTGAPGKEEAWMILEAEPGAVVWAGLQPGITRDRLAAVLHAGAADPRDLLQEHPVIAGMLLLIPAGTVHAIGGGILLAELQQPADRTFRLYDYGSDRELHREAGLAHLDPSARPLIWRPGQPPTELRGAHLRLRVLAGDRHQLPHPAAPRLLTVLRGGCHAADQRLNAGDLGLIVGALDVTLDRDALVVLGDAD